MSALDIEGAAGSITLEEAKASENPKSSGRLNGNGVTIDGRKAEDEKKPRPHHITLRDLRIWGCPGGGISAIQSDYITIKDCTVSGCAWYSTFACSCLVRWRRWTSSAAPRSYSTHRGPRKTATSDHEPSPLLLPALAHADRARR